MVGINIGKNKLSTDAVADYVHGIEMFGMTADYIVMNVSSPNTAGLRDLQHKKQLEELVQKVMMSQFFCLHIFGETLTMAVFFSGIICSPKMGITPVVAIDKA